VSIKAPNQESISGISDDGFYRHKIKMGFISSEKNGTFAQIQGFC